MKEETAWEKGDAEMVNRVLAPYAKRKRKVLQHRAASLARKRAKLELKLNRRRAKLERQREVLERNDCDRWLARTTEEQRQAEELYAMSLHDRPYPVSGEAGVSSVVVDLTRPEFVDLTDVVDVERIPNVDLSILALSCEQEQIDVSSHANSHISRKIVRTQGSRPQRFPLSQRVHLAAAHKLVFHVSHIQKLR